MVEQGIVFLGYLRRTEVLSLYWYPYGVFIYDGDDGDDDDDDLQLYNYTPYFGIGPIQAQKMQAIHLNLMLSM